MPVEISRSVLMRIEIQPLAPCRSDAENPGIPQKPRVFGAPPGEGKCDQTRGVWPAAAPAEQPERQRSGGAGMFRFATHQGDDSSPALGRATDIVMRAACHYG